MKTLSKILLSLTAMCAAALQAQDSAPYSHRQSLSLFTEYSNTSSHIILGVSQNRRLAAVGATYSRRLLHTRYVDWHYDLEARPFTLIQEPVAGVTLLSISPPLVFSPSSSPLGLGFPAGTPIQRNCTTGTVVYVDPATTHSPAVTYTYSEICGRRWTYAAGLSPLGQRFNFAPRHRLQPFVVGNAGFMVATRSLPSINARSFNFTFEFGAGLQLYRDHQHSWSAEYRIHHLSNAYTAKDNPGIDSQILKLTYTFGK